MQKLNQRLQKAWPEEKRAAFRLLQLRELVQLCSPVCQLREGAEAGRASGGLDWRVARMEVDEKAAQRPAEPVVIHLTPEEVEAKKFV